jgi:squalene synthase HpnC
MSASPLVDLDLSYLYCGRLARRHPENFFIGSLLLPRGKRRHLAAVYAYARIADDFADGDLPTAGKLESLDVWERRLDDALAGRATHPVFVALADTIETCALPVGPLRDLLTAFRYDADFRPFATYADLLGYCRNSANPVGRLVLGLFGIRDEERAALADSICSALQLTNFWQDLGVDLPRGRLYLPLEDLERFGIPPGGLERGGDVPGLRECLRFQVDRTRALFHEGLPLAERCPPRLRREVRMFAEGGLRILARIEEDGYATLVRRPRLTRGDKVRLLRLGLVGA